MRGLITFVLTALFVFSPFTDSPYVLVPLVLFAFYRTYRDLTAEHPDTKRYRIWLERRFPKESSAPDASSVTAEAVQATGEGLCPVCRREMDRPRSCPTCDTPHHADCWSWAGGCAMYACRQVKVKAKSV